MRSRAGVRMLFIPASSFSDPPHPRPTLAELLGVTLQVKKNKTQTAGTWSDDTGGKGRPLLDGVERELMRAVRRADSVTAFYVELTLALTMPIREVDGDSMFLHSIFLHSMFLDSIFLP
ncbi:hypothetical protein T484DRAFT_1851437 [Baffinella frigidus]|nr:hypothetical protein T484DRAFT_1851437 [Cryptophyta sp. CCMP2293]